MEGMRVDVLDVVDEVVVVSSMVEVVVEVVKVVVDDDVDVVLEMVGDEVVVSVVAVVAVTVSPAGAEMHPQTRRTSTKSRMLMNGVWDKNPRGCLVAYSIFCLERVPSLPLSARNGVVA
jgi:hypothetical protein